MTCLQKTHLSSKDKCRLHVKEKNMILQENCCQKKVGTVLPLSDKTKKGNKGQKWIVNNDKYLSFINDK